MAVATAVQSTAKAREGGAARHSARRGAIPVALPLVKPVVMSGERIELAQDDKVTRRRLSREIRRPAA